MLVRIKTNERIFGDFMLTIALIIIDILITSAGIYIFDYSNDGLINNPTVIGLSVISGIVVAITVLAIYIEGFYLIVAKRLPHNSMFKHKIAKQLMSIPLHFTNTRIKVVGLENLPEDPGFTIYANHTSMMDIPVLMYKLYDYPVAFLAKKVVKDLFSIGKWTPPLGCVSIERTNNRKGAESIIQVIKNVKRGLTMVVFPEGTRSSEIGNLLRFKEGSFRVALKSKAPLVPITIVKPKNFKKVKWPFPKRITLVIHKAIPFDEFREMKTNELSVRVEDVVASAL